MKDDELEYQSYLLRVWRTRETDRWRATLQAIPDGTPLGFATLADLLAALDGPPARPGSTPAESGPYAALIAGSIIEG